MRSGAYEQHRITNGPLADFDAEFAVRVTIKPKLFDGILTFEPKFRLIELASGTNYSDDLMNIYGDSIVTIRLHKSIKWRWSKRNDAVTTKGELSYFYGNLKYARSSNALSESYDIATFEARYDRSGQEDTKHGISLNVELLQADGQWLEITIDPDIPNPPPKKVRTDADRISPINEEDDEFELDDDGRKGILVSDV